MPLQVRRVYTRNKAGYPRDICTPMFIGTLFTIAKMRKQPKCPSTDERINKMQYIHTDGMSFNHKKEGNTDMCSIKRILY